MARADLKSKLALVFLAITFAAVTHARTADLPEVAISAFQPLSETELGSRTSARPKTAGNGLQIHGDFAYAISGDTVTVTLDRIQNTSSFRTTGALRLELWASTSMPAREASFSGYRLAVTTTLGPLAPNSASSNVARMAAFTPPPEGTYWLVLVLAEFDAVKCSTADHFCISDSTVFSSQRTFGRAVQLAGSFSYKTSGTSITIEVDRIENNATTETTARLRLELWATTTQPARGAPFTGYRLAISSTFAPLAPDTYYFNVVRNTTWVPPPDGTYWMVLVLSEFDSVNCAAADHFCIVDSGVFATRQTFGVPTPSIVTVIEYYHAGFDHYFVTGIIDEINKLDTGYFAGWVRTGLSFKAYAIAGAPLGTSNVCRFFSTAFGARSSHFYTPSATECLIVKGNPQWQFEAEVAAIASPVGVPGSKTCPAGYIPLYRLYNNGKDGAPNHRYTTSLAVFNQMRSIGWVFEGEGNTFVFACVPP